MRFVFASLTGRRAADQAVQALVDLHFDPKDIQVLVQGGGDVQRLHLGHRLRLRRRMAIGAVVGAVLAFSIGGLLHEGPALARLLGGTLLGALGGMALAVTHYKTRPRYPNGIAVHQPLLIGVQTLERRAEVAGAALRSVVENVHIYEADDNLAPQNAARAFWQAGGHATQGIHGAMLQ